MWRHIKTVAVSVDHGLSRQKVGKGAYMQSKTGVMEKNFGQSGFAQRVYDLYQISKHSLRCLHDPKWLLNGIIGACKHTQCAQLTSTQVLYTSRPCQKQHTAKLSLKSIFHGKW